MEFIGNSQSGKPVWQDASETVLLAIFNLFERSYWSRIWVIQEVLLARDIIVFCGSRGFKWGVLTRFVQLLARSIHYDDTFEEASGPGKPGNWKQNVETLLGTQAIPLILGQHHGKVVDHHTNGDTPLWHYISMYYTFKSTNPLDKTYGLLGMVPRDHPML
jgi:hypothetical protein